MSAALRRLEATLRTYALALPGATEEFPWGERVVKVRGKIFVFVNIFEDRELAVTVKLPRSSHAALALPGAKPTAYGLGKSGWVSFRFVASKAPPVALLHEWIDESYHAIAPKRLAATAPRVESRTRFRK